MFSETRSSKLLRFSALLFGVVFTLLPVRPIHAQVAGATLSGSVTDQSGAVVPNASIAIKNIATAVTRTVPTDSAVKSCARRRDSAWSGKAERRL